MPTWQHKFDSPPPQFHTLTTMSSKTTESQLLTSYWNKHLNKHSGFFLLIFSSSNEAFLSTRGEAFNSVQSFWQQSMCGTVMQLRFLAQAASCFVLSVLYRREQATKPCSGHMFTLPDVRINMCLQTRTIPWHTLCVLTVIEGHRILIQPQKCL